MNNLVRHYISELNTGILVLDESLRIQFLNTSAQSMLDTSLKASRKKELKELFYEEPDNNQKFKGCLNDQSNFAKVDALLFVKGGKRLLCDYHIQPFSNDSLGEGLIVEIGNHQELLDKNNHYAELYRIQFNKK